MKIAYNVLIIAALVAFCASPAFADTATYTTHPDHVYGPSANHYGPSKDKYGAAGDEYGPSKDKYTASAPKTGSQTHAYVSPTALATAVPY